MPAFRQHGVLLDFAAFQRHIGIFPPVAGDAELERALAPCRGPEGNLELPLDRPIPYDLIRRIVRLRVRQDREHAEAKAAKRAAKRPARRTEPLMRRR